MIDIQVEDFLEHHGIMGQKWGIRRDRRANRIANVGRGKSTVSEKIRTYGRLGPIDFVKGHGLRGGARRKGKRLLNANQKMRDGEATVRNFATWIWSTKQQDILPTSKKVTNTKAAIGSVIVGGILADFGWKVIKAGIRSKA